VQSPIEVTIGKVNMVRFTSDIWLSWHTMVHSRFSYMLLLRLSALGKKTIVVASI